MSPYCGECGAGVRETDAYCVDCGEQLTRDPDGSSNGTGGRVGRWYLGVAFPLIVTAAMLVLSFSLGFLTGAGALAEADTERWVDVIGALWALAMLFSIGVAPVAVYFDRQYLRRTREWTPSRLYYLSAIPVVNILLAVAYLGQRHRTRRTPTPAAHEGAADSDPTP